VKVMTVLGTRPEIIRLSRVIEKLDACGDHTLVHTGQNFTTSLNEQFFDELGVRRPDVELGIRAASAADQIGQIISRIDEVLHRVQPDRLLILGDTNSGLAAIPAKRRGISVFHMEAGNRCYDDRVPEEVNRRIIDHSSDVLMPYTNRSRDNLIREGIPHERIYVTGNPIAEVLATHKAAIDGSAVLAERKLEAGRYFLVTLHRAENVDVESRLRSFLEAFVALAREHQMPVVCSLHPRTRDRLSAFQLAYDPELLWMLEPLGFFDFVHLEKHAFCTVQEECCIFRVPSVTLRDVTERPETIECGSSVLSGADPVRIQKLVRQVTTTTSRWQPPAEYLVENVSDVVTRIVQSHHERLATS
jgi:UDP-N-acetylglucosamine 2-epimerase (non-hydrolysing)